VVFWPLASWCWCCYLLCVRSGQDGEAFQSTVGKGSSTPKKGQSAHSVVSGSESDEDDPIAKFVATHGKEHCHSTPAADAEFAKLVNALRDSMAAFVSECEDVA
jgi:hypothetical protein